MDLKDQFRYLVGGYYGITYIEDVVIANKTYNLPSNFSPTNLVSINGYIRVSMPEDNVYFMEIVYNYSKIEFYSSYSDLSFITANSLIILNSIKYNDSLIQLELSDDYKNYNEVKYELDKPEDANSNFSQILEEYVQKDEDNKTDEILPDE